MRSMVRCRGRALLAPRALTPAWLGPPLWLHSPVRHSCTAFPRPTPSPPPGSSLFVFGGQAVNVCQLNDVLELDLRTMEWRQLAAPRWCTAACRRQFEHH